MICGVKCAFFLTWWDGSQSYLSLLRVFGIPTVTHSALGDGLIAPRYPGN
jgi:hypothetical protein